MEKKKKKNPIAQAMAQMRHASLTAAQRKAIAKKAAATRWKEKEKEKKA